MRKYNQIGGLVMDFLISAGWDPIKQLIDRS